eukprot:1147783-Rhodomonas_salina.1
MLLPYGTDLGYAATRATATISRRRSRYAIGLRACYAMSGTDIAYGEGAREDHKAMSSTDAVYSAREDQVLTCCMALTGRVSGCARHSCEPYSHRQPGSWQPTIPVLAMVAITLTEIVAMRYASALYTPTCLCRFLRAERYCHSGWPCSPTLCPYTAPTPCP